MTIGMLVLVAVAIAIYLGAAQRVLDRLRLSDGAALLFVAAMVVEAFAGYTLSDNVAINIGGGIIPVILAVYLFLKAGTTREKCVRCWRLCDFRRRLCGYENPAGGAYI